MTSAATAVNHFSHRLFLTADDGNVAISPVSISLAMGMAYAGADGATADEIASVFTNAIYLEAPWMHPFEHAATKPGTFHAPEGDIEVSMMRQSESFRTFSGDGFEALELPFEGDTLTTIVVLPDAGRIEHVASDLTADRFAQMLDGLEYTYTDVRLPRFTVRKHLSLRTVLEDMGMPGAFSRDANFDDISPEFSIDEVIHETYIDVDENGTQTAAASAVVMFGGGVPEDPTPFVVDRPFLFYIVDKASGAILFAARILNPSLDPETRSGLA